MEYFSSTNFAENLKVCLSRNRILSNFEEILVNASSLLNYGDFFVEGLLTEVCALECRKLHAKCEKNSKFYCGSFSFIKMEKNAYVS